VLCFVFVVLFVCLHHVSCALNVAIVSGPFCLDCTFGFLLCANRAAIINEGRSMIQYTAMLTL
jgi:hypothetical protein